MRTVIAIVILIGISSGASAQPSPMSDGPLGTPMTPPVIGAWCFTGSISAAEARSDARAQGFSGARGLHQDAYGNWFGRSARGEFVVFPDGLAFAL